MKIELDHMVERVNFLLKTERIEQSVEIESIVKHIHRIQESFDLIELDKEMQNQSIFEQLLLRFEEVERIEEEVEYQRRKLFNLQGKCMDSSIEKWCMDSTESCSAVGRSRWSPYH